MFLKVVLLLYVVQAGIAQVLKFQNAKSYKPMDPSKYGQTVDSKFPLGFQQGMVPYPPDDPANPPLVISLNKLNVSYIQIRVETIDNGASMCVRDDSTGPEICGQGQIVDCYTPSKYTLKFEFYCKDSCQSSDIHFYYRITTSPAEAPDQWCADQSNDYPSNLQPQPSVYPTKKSTPPKPAGPLAAGDLVVFPVVLITILSVVASIYLN